MLALTRMTESGHSVIATGLWLALGVWLTPGVGVVDGVELRVLEGDVSGVGEGVVGGDAVGLPPPAPRSSQPPATSTTGTARTMARLNQ